MFSNPSPNDKSHLKQAIKEFLSAAAATPPGRLNCPQCGQPMQYIDTVFWLYGEERSFPIRLQRCPCTAGMSRPSEPITNATREIH